MKSEKVLEEQVKLSQKVINLIGKVVGFANPLNEKEFEEIDTGHFVSVDKYLEKQNQVKK